MERLILTQPPESFERDGYGEYITRICEDTETAEKTTALLPMMQPGRDLRDGTPGITRTGKYRQDGKTEAENKAYTQI